MYISNFCLLYSVKMFEGLVIREVDMFKCTVLYKFGIELN